MIDHLSASQIKTLLFNPKRWAFEKLWKLPQPTSPAAEVGKLIHSAIETYLLGGDPEEHDLAVHCLESLINVGDLDKIKNHRGVCVEHEFEMGLSVSLPPVVGYIDVFIPDYFKGCPLIIDHKTSKTRKYFLSTRDLKDDIQLILYAYYAINLTGAKGAFIQHNQLAYSLKKQPLQVRRTYVSRKRVFTYINNLVPAIKASMKEAYDIFKAGEHSDHRPMCDRCSTRFGKASCPYEPICCGAISVDEYRVRFSEHQPQTVWDTLDIMKKVEVAFKPLTENAEKTIIKEKEGKQMLHLEELVGKARPQVANLASVWDRREAITKAVVSHILASKAEAVIAPSHFGEGVIDPDYLPIITQLKENKIKILVEV